MRVFFEQLKMSESNSTEVIMSDDFNICGRGTAHIRWMIRRDMMEVLDIEADCFEFPWSDDDFVRCLRQRNCIGIVAECGTGEDAYDIAGYMIYELHKSRLHILNFAVARKWRRCGIGSALAQKLIGKLSAERRTRVCLEVRETNLPAQLFWRSQGFRAVSVFREYFEDTTEDAYLMQYRFGQGEPATSPAWLGVNRMLRVVS